MCVCVCVCVVCVCVRVYVARGGEGRLKLPGEESKVFKEDMVQLGPCRLPIEIVHPQNAHAH